MAQSPHSEDQGASALPTGLSSFGLSPQAVSPAPASIPRADGSNWTRKVVAVWEEWRFGPYRAYKNSFDGPWHLCDQSGVLYCDTFLSDVMAHAQAIEARRAETAKLAPSPDETAVPQGMRPNPSQGTK